MKINIGQINKSFLNKKIKLLGWINNKRKFKNKIFIEIRDFYGIFQVVLEQKKFNISKESVVEFFGEILLRKDPNLNLKNGDLEMKVFSYELISENLNTLPFEISDVQNSSEELRLKYRFLELRNAKIQNILKFRFRFFQLIRKFLESKEFIEIETPILSKTTPEGARDYLVLTRNEKKFFALPQSPQIYKQLLMISGFPKYFQIAKVFRDEDLRKDRQPEFSQLDLEISFVNEEEIFNLTEELFKNVLQKLGYQVKIPFLRMDYDFALKNYGTDKPDLRFGFLIEDVKKYFFIKNEFLFSQSHLKAIFFDQNITKKQQKIMIEIAKKNGSNKVFFVNLDENQKVVYQSFVFQNPKNQAIFLSNLDDFLLSKNKNIKTVIFCADNENNSLSALGSIRNELNQIFHLSKKNELNFVWIVNWPMFEKDLETQTYHPMHHPFTQIKNPAEKEISKMQARCYDLVLNGFELASGSIRNHNVEMQKKIFDLLGISHKVQREKFGFFLDALSFGAPPHGGIAFGLERIIMILKQTNSIRDVIAFPKNAKGYDLMNNSPSEILSEELKDYKIKYLESEK